MRRPQRLRRDDEFTPRQRQRRRPRHPHEGGNAEHAENEGEIEDRLPEKGGHGQRQDQGRKRQQHVHAADHHRLEPAAEIAGEHAERAADDEPDHRRAQRRQPAISARHRSAARVRRGRARRFQANAPPRTVRAAPACPCRSGSAAAGRSAKIATANTKIIQPIATQNSSPKLRRALARGLRYSLLGNCRVQAWPWRILGSRTA